MIGVPRIPSPSKQIRAARKKLMVDAGESVGVGWHPLRYPGTALVVTVSSKALSTAMDAPSSHGTELLQWSLTAGKRDCQVETNCFKTGRE